MSDNSRVLGALVLGAAAGAVLGLLFAPSKGSDLRKKITDNASDLIDELTDKINESKNALADLREKAMSKAEDIKATAEEHLDSYKTKAKPAGSGTHN
jgi:gas vesicle protein